jgi:hypothetical protein
MVMEQPQGFFGSLFDLSFSSFVTTKIIKVLYVLGIIMAGLSSLAVFISAARNGVPAAIVGLIFAPLVFLLGVLYSRVMLEIIIVVFRIAENTGEIARQGRSGSAGGSPVNAG